MKRVIGSVIFFFVAVNFLSAQTIRSSQNPIPISPWNFSGEALPNSLLIPRESYRNFYDPNHSMLGGTFPPFVASQTGFDFLLEKTFYNGIIKNRIGLFSFEISIEIPDSRWVIVPLPGGDISYLNVEWDNKPIGLLFDRFSGIKDPPDQRSTNFDLRRKQPESSAKGIFFPELFPRKGSPNSFGVVIKDPGKHVLSGNFLVPQIEDPERNELSFQIPRVFTNAFDVEFEKTDQCAEIDWAEGTLSEERPGGGTRISGVLGKTDRFTVRWKSREKNQPTEKSISKVDSVLSPSPVQVAHLKPSVPPKLFSESMILLTFGEAFLRYESKIKINISGSTTDFVEFLLPQGLDLIEVQSGQIDTYSQTISPAGTTVKCRLNSRIQGTVTFDLVCDYKMTGVSQDVSVPIHQIIGARRDKGFIGVGARTTIEIRKKEKAIPAKPNDSEGLRGVSPKDGSLPANRPDGDALAGVPRISAIDASGLPPGLTQMAKRPILLGYRYSSPPKNGDLHLDIIRYKDIPVLTTVIDFISAITLLEANQTSLSSLDLRVKNNGKQFLEMTLPADSQIDSVKLEGKPVNPSKKDETRFLIPLLSGIEGRPLSDFELKIMYKSKISDIPYCGKMNFTLPSFDISVSRLDWKAFFPENVTMIPLKSQLENGKEEFLFLPFICAKNFLSLIYDFIQMYLKFIVPLCLCFFLFWLKNRRLFDSLKDYSISLNIALTFILLFAVTLVILGSLELTSKPGNFSGRQVGKGLPASGRPAETTPFGRFAGFGTAGTPPSLDGRPEKTSPSGRISGTPPSLDGRSAAVQSKQPGGNETSEPAEHGILPVEMKIPTTSNSRDFFRNLVNKNEETQFQGIILYNPIMTCLQIVLACWGAFCFLFVFCFSRSKMPKMAFLVFLGFSASSYFLEINLPGSQKILFIFFFLGFPILIFENVFRLIKGLFQQTVVVSLLVGISVSCFGEEGHQNRNQERWSILSKPMYGEQNQSASRTTDMIAIEQSGFPFMMGRGPALIDSQGGNPPFSVTFLNLELIGKVENGILEIHLRSYLDLIGPGIKAIGIPDFGMGIRSLSLNGDPVKFLQPGKNSISINSAGGPPFRPYDKPFDDESPWNRNTNLTFFSDKEGRFCLEAKLVKNIGLKEGYRSETGDFKLPLPPFASGKLYLSLDRPNRSVKVHPSTSVDSIGNATSTVIKAFLQPSPELTVEWREPSKTTIIPKLEKENEIISSQALVLPEPKIFIDHEILFSVKDDFIEGIDNLKLKIEQAPVENFRISIPSGTSILDISGSDLSGWEFVNSSDTREVRITLKAPIKGNFQCRIELEKEVFQTKESAEVLLDIPFFHSPYPNGKIERQKGYFGIGAMSNLELIVLSAIGATLVDPSELPQSVTSASRGFLSYAFKFITYAKPGIKIIRHAAASVKTGSIDGARAMSFLTETGRIFTRLDLTVRNNNNQFLVFESLPENQSIISVLVNGSPTKPGVSKTGEIHISLIRSQVIDNVFKPFEVTVFLEQKIPQVNMFGKLDLVLPKCSFDISEMSWKVFTPADLGFYKLPGGFQSGECSISQSRGRVSNFFLNLFFPNLERSIERTQLANMRVILGAIEMFNMDNPSMDDSSYSKQEATKAAMSNIKTALVNYSNDLGKFPHLAGAQNLHTALINYNNQIGSFPFQEKIEESAIGADGAGYFPVVLEIPETSNWQVFSKKLVIGRNPQLELFFFSMENFDFIKLLFSLFICFWGSILIAGFFNDYRFLGPGMFLLIASGLVLALLEANLGNNFPLFSHLLIGYFDGLISAPAMILCWLYLSSRLS